jgi:hypothetical protein
MSIAQQKPRHGHLAPFLAALVARSGLPLKVIAAETDVSMTRLSARLYRPDPLAPDRVAAIVRACGGTDDDVRRARVLDALDRGVVFVPAKADEATVARAMAVLDGAT